MKPGILAIDIGGTGLKAVVLDDSGTMETARERRPTPHPCPPSVLLNNLAQMVASLPAFDRIAVGFPGVVRAGQVLTAPNLGTKDWAGFDLAQALSRQFGGHPVKLLNDAEVQGYSLMSGQGLELVVTLGTGVGTALFRDGELMPHMELAHHPLHKDKTYDSYLGAAACSKAGKKRWNKRLRRALAELEALLTPDRIVLGGGNSAHVVGELPPNVSVGSNAAGLLGGAALWHRHGKKLAARRHER